MESFSASHPPHNEEIGDISNALEARGTGEFIKKEDMLARLVEANLHEAAEAYEKVCEIAAAIQKAGGRALLVGGSVRDIFFGSPSKDFDLEIYGLQPSLVREVLSSLGENKNVGEAFGIIHVPLQSGLGIDVSLPRADSIPGNEGGGKDFDTTADPAMSIKDAAARRDFTMNALAADPLTGELFDYYGGVADIKEKVLRITDPERFVDDPLRVLRGMQFIARFGLSPDSASAEIMKQIAHEIAALPISRITPEWEKLLVRGQHIDMALETMRTIGVCEILYGELSLLKDTPQEPEWHPEGDVWIHTLMVVQEAKKICEQHKLSKEDTFAIMLAALLHDTGKPATTMVNEKGRITAHGHEPKGEEPTRQFLAKITEQKDLVERVVRLVVNHMTPHMLYDSHQKNPVSNTALTRLAKRLAPDTIETLVLLCEADHRGRGTADAQGPCEAGIWLRQKSEIAGVYSQKPENIIGGKELISLSCVPGKTFGEIIALANRIRDYERSLCELQGVEVGDIRQKILDLVADVPTTESEKRNPQQVLAKLTAHGFSLLRQTRELKEQKRKEKESE